MSCKNSETEHVFCRWFPFLQVLELDFIVSNKLHNELMPEGYGATVSIMKYLVRMFSFHDIKFL